jgi:hypothetical protein
MHTLADILSLFEGLLQDKRVVPLMVILSISVLLLWSARRRIRERGRQEQRASAQREPPALAPGEKAQLRRDLESLIMELQELSRKISAEIDTRFAKLEAALQDADRRIAVLNRLTRQTGESAAKPSPSASTVRGSDSPEERYTAIYELADVGFTPVEIARDLGRTPGEVELILNLRKQGQSKTSTPGS